MRAIVGFVALCLSAAFLTPLTGGAREPSLDRVYDERGRVVAEFGTEADDARIGFARYYHYPDEQRDARASEAPALTDCTSTKYQSAGWRWTGPVSFVTSAYVAQISASLQTWDVATGASISGTVSVGSSNAAGTFDGVNQIDRAPLGSGGTIAVTTTWYYRSTGQAVGSDARYNTYYAWSTSGEAGKMDVQNIATHEIGHTLGLDHPRGKGVSCLTMYAYGSFGETAKQTLGDGDLRGIRALYGA